MHNIILHIITYYIIILHIMCNENTELHSLRCWVIKEPDSRNVCELACVPRLRPCTYFC